ncbi:hypothetical protein BT96DRAFT_952504 [Gymnopus androsaceus JB14]|uniref:Uncharacterized protein n=1 Tax=Gymnopus androsaceus JB14 TaxID=1447944 RepID=A0A6A4IVM6_9AGAR|nr:hypothetical protein BT96DRAFT_952504 [Gymnopus androsaceus JB14]
MAMGPTREAIYSEETEALSCLFSQPVPFQAPRSQLTSRPFDEGKKEKRRKDLSGKVGKEISDRRDDMNMEEAYGLERAQTAYEEERLRVEDEWKKGRDRVRERLMEGIEERRRRAREDKEGEGPSADASLDSQNRSHITRKLRNKIGTSPPPTPAAAFPNATPGAISSLPITSGPFLNPHSLSVDEIPSPFPLPLTSTTIPVGGGAAVINATPSANPSGGRRRPKGSGTHQSQAIGGLGKSLAMLSASKETEIEADLGEIRRGNKRRRAAVASGVKQ